MPRRVRLALDAVFLTWAFGSLWSEGLQQVAAAGAMLLALLVCTKGRPRVTTQLAGRPFASSAAASRASPGVERPSTAASTGSASARAERMASSEGADDSRLAGGDATGSLAGAAPDSDARLTIGCALALAAWQLLSPGIALLTGAASRWPSSGRFLQSLDVVALAALIALVPLGVPWRALGRLLAAGWALELALATYQHLVRWPFERLGPLRFPLNRLHENYARFDPASPPRYAGLGFFFHRLRFAHSAIAILGPALALAASAFARKEAGEAGRSHRAQQLAAAALTIALLGCVYLSLARAALAAAAVVVAAAIVLFLRGWGRIAAIAAAAVVAGAVALSPSWRSRIEPMRVSLLGGERHISLDAGLRLARAHPVFGVGYGNHQRAALAMLGPEAPADPVLVSSAHNLLLTVWAETGAIGIGFFLALQIALARAFWRRWRAGSPLAAGALLSLVGFHALGALHNVPYHSGVMLTFCLIWAFGFAEGGRAPALRAPSPAAGDKPPPYDAHRE